MFFCYWSAIRITRSQTFLTSAQTLLFWFEILSRITVVMWKFLHFISFIVSSKFSKSRLLVAARSHAICMTEYLLKIQFARSRGRIYDRSPLTFSVQLLKAVGLSLFPAIFFSIRKIAHFSDWLSQFMRLWQEISNNSIIERLSRYTLKYYERYSRIYYENCCKYETIYYMI